MRKNIFEAPARLAGRTAARGMASQAETAPAKTAAPARAAAVRPIAAALAAAAALILILFALSAEPAHAASNFIIEDFDVEMTVNEDDTYDIHETLKVHFTAPSHGIYRTIPYKTTLDRDGQVSTFYAKVSNFKMLSDQPYKLEKRNSSAYFRIGDANRFEDEDTVYEYTYTYDTGGDHLKNGDEVYQNLVGTTWEAQSIDHVSFKVTFPKDIDMNNVGLKTGDQIRVDFKNDGNRTVYGETTESTLRGLTIRAVLPDGYFTRQAKANTIVLYILLGILAVICAAGVVLWRRFGVDPDVVEPVEFYPPEGLTPAEVGYLADGDIKGEHVISMLLSLADRGFIKITEVKSTSKFLKREITEYTITKLKDVDSGLIGEKTFMNGLFKGGRQTVKVSDLTDSFYKTVDDIKGKITKKYEKKLHDQKAEEISGILNIIVIIGMAALVIVTKISNGSPVIQDGDFIWSIILLVTCTLLPCFGFYMISSRVNAVKRGVGGFFIILLGVIVAACGFGMALLFEVLTPEQILPYIAGMAIIFHLSIVAALCQRKSDYYADILGKIRGYRNFLKHAEKDRIEMLAEEDPDFFYKTLAFAFALGVTSVFAKNFASLATQPPQWYETNSYYSGSTFNSMAMMNSLDSMMSKTGSSMTSSPSSSGSGGGSFSGGGGGGGGGGGSW